MGCDFELLIQALHGSSWVTIARFGTKTSCGGYPLCHATRDFLKAEGVRGHYGMQHKVVFSAEVGTSYVLHQSEPVFSSKSEGRLLLVSEEVDAGHEYVDKDYAEEDEDLDDEGWEKRKGERHYKGAEGFSRLIGYIKGAKPLSMWSDYPHTYCQIMAPVPKWCEMARSALPLEGGEIWMSDEAVDIEETTTALLTSQQTLLEQYADLLLTIIPSWPELVKLVAPYAVPYAADVRVVWSDDEGQSEELRAGKAFSY